MPIIAPSAAKPEYDVIIVGSGAGGGQMALTLTLAGLKCVMLEAGRSYDPAPGDADVPASRPGAAAGQGTPDKYFGFYRCHRGRRLAGAGRALHPGEREGRGAVHVVARAHARRPHQPLGTHLAAQRALRLQAAQPRRAGLRLADLLRGRRALLHQGRAADRRLRQQRGAREHPGFARRRAPAAAQGPRRGAAHPEARQDPRHPGDPASTARCSPAASMPTTSRPGSSPATSGRRRSSPTRCTRAPPASGPPPAGAAAASAPTTRAPPCTSRRRWRLAISTSSPTRMRARSRSAPTAGPAACCSSTRPAAARSGSRPRRWCWRRAAARPCA